jgi:2'-5' RNA ligase
MGYAVEAYFDTAATKDVLARCQAIDSSILSLGAMPHISLSLHDEVDLPLMERIIQDFAQRQRVIKLNMETIASFMTDECVLYLAPTITASLLAMHADFHRRLRDNGIQSNEYYLPDRWVPHCTLDFEISREDLVSKFAICHAMGGVNQIKLETIGLIEFRPVREYFRYPLQQTR